LEDYNVLVLKKDIEIFLKTHLEVKFDFYTYSNEKILNYKVINIQHVNTLVKKNIIQLTHCVRKIVLKRQKTVKNLAKNHIEG